MFKEIRRRDRKISDDECKGILEKGQYGILSTIGEDGYPYGVPVSYSYKEGIIYFHCAVEGKKIENFKFNDRVSFCVVGESTAIPEKFSMKYESVIIFGRVYEVEGSEKDEALFELVKKYSGGFLNEGREYIEQSGSSAKVYAIKAENMCGKARR